MEKRLERKQAIFRIGFVLGFAGTKGGQGLCNEGAEGTAKGFCGYRRKTPRGRGCETNPILHKPVWKSYRNGAKNEPKLGRVAGARGAVCGWEIILFIWFEVWQLHRVCDF